MRAATSKTSAPWSIPTRSTRILDLGAGLDHAEEAGGPADQPGRRPGLAIGGGGDMLCGGREPHAVHDRRFQAGQQRGGAVGVDRVVVAGDHGERPHVGGRGDGDVAATTTRRVGGVVGDRAAGAHGVGEFRTAPCRPRIAKRSSRVASTVPSAAVTVTATGTTRPTSVSVAAEAVAVTVNSAGSVGNSALQMRRMVEVHQAQQTFHDREARHRWPPSRWPRTPRASSGPPARRAPPSASAPSGAPNVAVTPVWSATSSGFHRR